MESLADRKAIDFHVHVTKSLSQRQPSDGKAIMNAASKHFGRDAHGTIEDVAAYYEERDIGCVVFVVDSETHMGRIAAPNEEVAEYAAKHPTLMIPFASVDPWKGKLALNQAKQLITQYGVKGFKFHPSSQGFFPNDRRFYPLYQEIADAGLPAIFHTGQTGIGAKMPGGGGIKLKYANPMYIDDVAADFPDLTIIMAHPSVPWQDEGLAVALHKPNVYMDLSGWSPKYFEAKLVTYMKRLLTDKVLFGSDFPLITPDRWIRDFDELGLPEDVRRKVFKDNACALLGLPADGMS